MLIIYIEYNIAEVAIVDTYLRRKNTQPAIYWFSLKKPHYNKFNLTIYFAIPPYRPEL